MDPLVSVLILYNEPQPAVDYASRVGLESDESVLDEVHVVGEALDKLGIPWRSAGILVLKDIPSLLNGSPEPIVFNLVEGLGGDVHAVNSVPAVCEAMGRSCTGESSACFEFTHNKWLCKHLLRAYGVVVPSGCIVPVGVEPDPARLPPGPWFIKPVQADASEGIEPSSMVALSATASIPEVVRKIHTMFQVPALIEQYIDGREINVSILREGGSVRIMPLAEIDFGAFPAGQPRIVDYSAKWLKDSFQYQNTPRKVPADLPPAVADRIREQALMAWQAVEARDYARVDMRLNADLEPFVLEINANPDISLDAGFAAALKAGRIPYERFVKAVVENAWSRFELRKKHVRRSRRRTRTAGGPEDIRWTVNEDRDAILKLITDTNVFRPDEIVIAEEVLDDALVRGENGHYQSYTFMRDNRPVGWVCFGPTPCTVGTFDVYWLATDPAFQGKGIGKALMAHAERLITERGGRLSVVETAGRAVYTPTRTFYERRGYRQAARVPDFYGVGDDKVIYTKPLPA